MSAHITRRMTVLETTRSRKGVYNIAFGRHDSLPTDADVVIDVGYNELRDLGVVPGDLITLTIEKAERSL